MGGTVDATTVPVANVSKLTSNAANFIIGTEGATSPVIFMTNGNEQMRLTSAGNVGVGTTSPQSAIETFYSGSYSNSEAQGNGLQTSTGHTVATDYTLYMGADKTNQLSYIQSVQWGIATAPLVLNGRGGNVGIGTSPVAILTVASGGTPIDFGPVGNCGIPGMYFSGTSFPTCGTVTAIMNDNLNDMIFNIPTGSSYSFRINNNSLPDAMNISPTGNVGIGTISPGYKIDVNGDINIDSTHALRFAGTSVCTSAGCTSSSDRTLKEHIQPLQDSLDKVLKPQGVEYDYKDKAKFTEKHQVGVIAQDVEKVYPEVVNTDSKTGLKAVA